MSDLIERLEEPAANLDAVSHDDDAVLVREAAAALRAQRPQPMTAQEAWQDLIEKDDRTSPAEYPEMALITQEEIASYMAAAVQQPQPIETAPRNPNSGHGHVHPRPDGVRMRCGGPGVCPECSRDLAKAWRAGTLPTPPQEK